MNHIGIYLPSIPTSQFRILLQRNQWVHVKYLFWMHTFFYLLILYIKKCNCQGIKISQYSIHFTKSFYQINITIYVVWIICTRSDMISYTSNQSFIQAQKIQYVIIFFWRIYMIWTYKVMWDFSDKLNSNHNISKTFHQLLVMFL